MSIRKLAGQTAIYGISSVGPRVLNFLLNLAFTYFFTAADFGVVTDLYALIPFALVLLTLGLESGYFRFAGKAGSGEEKNRVFGTLWGTVTLLSIVFMTLVLLFNGQIAGWMGYSATPSFVWLTGAIIVVDAFAAMPFARLRQQGRAKRFVAVKMTAVVVNILMCLFFYGLLPRLAAQGTFTSLYDPSFGAGYVLVANLAGSLAAVAMLLPSCRGIRMKAEGRVLRPVLLYSLPLLLSGIAGTANEYIDRQMIKYLLPPEVALAQLGQFGAVSKLGVVLLLFMQMYRYGAEPYFLGSFKKDDFVKMNAQAMKYYLIAAIAIFLGVTLFADLFALMIGPGLREGMPLLPVILISNILSGVVLNLSFWYKQMSRTKYAIVVTGIGLLFTVVFNVLLVPRMGIWGSAIARLICETVMVAVSYALNRKYCPTPYQLRRIGEYVLLGAALYGASRFTAMMPRIPEYLCNLAFLGVYARYFLKREKIDLRSVVRR